LQEGEEAQKGGRVKLTTNFFVKDKLDEHFQVGVSDSCW
jgi:hypothetical protein